jgi:hypothetical protein
MSSHKAIANEIAKTSPKELYFSMWARCPSGQRRKPFTLADERSLHYNLRR